MAVSSGEQKSKMAAYDGIPPQLQSRSKYAVLPRFLRFVEVILRLIVNLFVILLILALYLVALDFLSRDVELPAALFLSELVALAAALVWAVSNALGRRDWTREGLSIIRLFWCTAGYLCAAMGGMLVHVFVPDPLFSTWLVVWSVVVLAGPLWIAWASSEAKIEERRRRKRELRDLEERLRQAALR